MRIETRRFIMEELTSEEETKIFAQISRKMAWRDTVELLLNEKKLDAYIRNVAKRDMELFLAERQRFSGEHNGRLLSNQIRIVKQQTVFDKHYQSHMLRRFIETNRNKVLAYRQQLLDLCEQKGVRLKTDKNGVVVGIRNSDLDKIRNEDLAPPIPIEDWHYNIQFLKPTKKSLKENGWEAAAGQYVREGIEANKASDRSFFYFKIIDKSNGHIVGISRICCKEQEFIINYDNHDRPIKQTLIGDPGLFLDPSCQGGCRGTEIYVTTLNLLYNFLRERGDKSDNVFIKCNVLNQASRRLQRLIGASVTNKDRPIGNRYYFVVNERDILESVGLKKLERLGVDNYTVTLDDGKTHTVSLREGIVRKNQKMESFLTSIQKMMGKVGLSRPKIEANKVANAEKMVRSTKILTNAQKGNTI